MLQQNHPVIDKSFTRELRSAFTKLERKGERRIKDIELPIGTANLLKRIMLRFRKTRKKNRILCAWLRTMWR